MAVERNFSILKPDATERNLTGAINAIIEKAGLRIVAQKRVRISREQAEKFYAVHRERPFFWELVEFMISGPVVVQVLEGEKAIARYREVMGATDPVKAADGTIRKIHARSIGEICCSRLGCTWHCGTRNCAVLFGQRNRRIEAARRSGNRKGDICPCQDKPRASERGTGEERQVGSMSQLMDPASWWALVSSGWNDIGHTEFWIALAKIMWINILLSGDNAVVIAMACRGLPHRQRVWGMILGAGVAVGLRIIFTGVVASLMLLPYLKIVGGLALFYIAAKLLVPEDPDESEAEAAEHLWRAVRIVAIADIIMSFDNVIAIAAAAGGNMALLVIGLGISIPLIVAGAALIMSLLDRFPILVWAGAALLGWIVGEVIATDPVIANWLTSQYGTATAHKVEIGAAAVGAALVLLVGGLWRRSKLQPESET